MASRSRDASGKTADGGATGGVRGESDGDDLTRRTTDLPSGDYYDPHPRLVLDRPVLLAGQIGCGAAAIARNVCARTGLSFVEIDRDLEHRAGRSLARIATEDGPGRLEAWAGEVLLHLARQRPAGLVVLSNAWPPQDSGFLEELASLVQIVRIDRSPQFLGPRLDTAVSRSGDWIVSAWPGWAQAMASDTVQDRASRDRFLARRSPLLDSAQTLLDAGDQHENAAAEILMAALERVLDADRL